MANFFKWFIVFFLAYFLVTLIAVTGFSLYAVGEATMIYFEILQERGER